MSNDLAALIADRLNNANTTRQRIAARKAAPEVWYFTYAGDFVEGESAPHFVEGYNVLRYKEGDVPPANAIAHAYSYNGLFEWYKGVTRAISASGGARVWKSLAEIYSVAHIDLPPSPYPSPAAQSLPKEGKE